MENRITAGILAIVSFVIYPAMILGIAAGVSGCGIESGPARLQAVASGSIQVIETVTGSNQGRCNHQMSAQYKDDMGDIRREITNGLCPGQTFIFPFPVVPIGGTITTPRPQDMGCEYARDSNLPGACKEDCENGQDDDMDGTIDCADTTCLGNVLCRGSNAPTFSFALLPPESDGDLDGVLFFKDNCPRKFNPGQQDDDLDGVGTACDNSEDLGEFERMVAMALENCPRLNALDPTCADNN